MYKQYVKCLEPVEVQANGNIVHQAPTYDDKDAIDHLSGYCCAECLTKIEHCGFPVQTTDELLDYLMLDPVVRKQQQDEYDALEAARCDEETIKQQNRQTAMAEVFDQEHLD
jgi:hypothetical protein